MKEIESLSEDRLRAQPGGDQWSILQTLQHLVLAEQGMRASEAELRANPVRDHLRPGKLINVVRDILVRSCESAAPEPGTGRYRNIGGFAQALGPGTGKNERPSRNRHCGKL